LAGILGLFLFLSAPASLSSQSQLLVQRLIHAVAVNLFTMLEIAGIPRVKDEKGTGGEK